MVSSVISSTENNFTKGLVTEFTGMNFPENAATETDNCTYTLVGNVLRREGIDLEENFQFTSASVNCAYNSYKWNNAGGDGLSQVIVVQSGNTLNFFLSSVATEALPLSTKILPTPINLPAFTAQGNIFDPTAECTFADGNGYLFVYHTSCDPFFCSYNQGIVTATPIQVKIRDFTGVTEPGVAVNDRPINLTQEHLYNLTNQGWTQGSPWAATSVGSPPTVIGNGTATFTVPAGITGVTLGDIVTVAPTTNQFPGNFFVAAGTAVMSGTVTSYAGNSLTVNVTGSLNIAIGSQMGPYNISPINHGYITTWQNAIGNFPSNADVWWYFKDNINNFNPATTASQVTLNTGPAPAGHFILPAFDLNRTLASGLNSLTDVSTSFRPTNGAWFSGRVWYTGLNASFPAVGDADFYTWSENIYFSQIVETPADFGACYQINDPTSETLFDELSTDGGVIKIQGAGAIYKLFPIQNGMLVFATNGIWFITGSQGIGFAANDYTITKISSVQSISSTSFVDVQGLPYFWNEEGIYSVQPSQSGSLTVEPITIGTILDFYNSIPLTSKQFVRGSYHPVDYVIQWVYVSTAPSGSIFPFRYQFDRILNYNTYNKAFFPYSVTVTPTSIAGIIYVSGTSPDAGDPVFKYLTITGTGNNFTFADEHDTSYVDWASTSPSNYSSFFITGYKLHGGALKKFSLPYIYVYSNADVPTAYVIQSLWDYANSGRSGQWSSAQTIYNNKPYYGNIFRRHRLRGHGLILQLKVTSVDGQPFNILGWATYENLQQGV